MPSELHILDEGDRWMEARFPFDRDFIDMIKTLPSGAYKWDPEEKTWSIDREHKRQFIAMGQFHFQKVMLTEPAEKAGEYRIINTETGEFVTQTALALE